MRLTLLIGCFAMTLNTAWAASPVLFHDLWNYGDPAATAATFEALPAPDTLDARLQLQTQIARTQGLRGDFAGARATLKAVADQLPAEPDTARLRWALELGRVKRSSGDKDAARPHFEAARQLGVSLAVDGLTVDAIHMLALVVSPGEAEGLNLEALALAESSSDPDARRWRGSLLNNLGWTHHEAGRHEEALVVFMKAVAARTEAGKPGPLFIARWCVARTKRSLGRHEEALAEQQRLSADRSAAKLPEDGYVQEEIAELLLVLGRADEAKPHFAKAAELLGGDGWFARNEAERLARLEELAK